MLRLLLLLFCAATLHLSQCTESRPKASDSWVVTSDADVAAPLTPRRAKADAVVDADTKCEPEVLTYHFRSAIKYRYASTQVHSRMANCDEVARELNFTVNLPENAFISDFVIQLGKHVYRGHVHAKEHADVVYQDALRNGVGAAQVSLSGRDLNLYHVVVNVEPRSMAIFNLTYEELLTRRLDAYNFKLTPNPGQVVDDLLVEVSIQEARKLVNFTSWLEGDSHRFEGDDARLVINRTSSKSATIVFRPSAGFPWKSSHGEHLRLRYDVERTSQTGDVLLMDGYFVHFFAPRSLPPLNKHVIFALDTSGSMWGRKMEQMQDAITTILTTLRRGDFFSIVTFGTEVTVWTPYQMSYNLVGIRNLTATHEVNAVNLENAIDYIKTLKAAGGTNVEGALRKSLQIAAQRAYPAPTEAVNATAQAGGPKPLVIFLTDGIPTNGELRSFKILSLVRAANSEVKAPIFSLALGDEANQLFLKKLALQHNGFSRRIYEAADASLQLQEFYKEVSSPLLSDVTFVYKGLKVNRTSVTKSRFHTYFGGSELVIAGRILDSVGSSQRPDDANDKFGTEIQGKLPGPDPDDFEIHVAATGTAGRKLLKNKRKLGKRKHSTAFVYDRPFGVLEKMWAHLSIRQHLDKDIEEEGLEEKGSVRTSHKDDALRLALKYQFVTTLTSLVVVRSDYVGASSIAQLNAFAWDDEGSRTKTTSKTQAVDFIRNKPNIMTSLAEPLPFARPMLVDKRPPTRSTPAHAPTSPPTPAHTSPPKASSTAAPKPASTAAPKPPSTTSSKPVPTTTSKPASTAAPKPAPTAAPKPAPTIPPKSVPLPGPGLSTITWLAQRLDSKGRLVVPGDYGQEPTAYLLDPIPATQVNATREACLTPDDEPGFCRVLSDCVLDIFADDFEEFLDFFCPVGKHAGVCCPTPAAS